MAPPKRKTVGGRTTARKTTPGGSTATGQRIANPEANTSGVHASSRYTPPVPASAKMPIPWIPYLMVALLIVGMVVIMLRNLVFTGNNWLTLVGLACILGGLFTATKWR